MSFTRKTHVSYIAAWFLFASIFLAGTVAAADRPMRSHQVKGEISAIDLNQHTITLKTKDFSGPEREVVIRAEKNTKLAKCGVGLYGDIGSLKVGDRVVVSYYEVNNQLYAQSVSPREVCS